MCEYIIYADNEELSSPAKVFLEWLIDFGKRSLWA